ncbi:YcgL domain-containing protein [Phytohalomonas tamaricis]|uniref:YcgL domain-containing protein n=1 Tax=Phytohalomonas tamaricis TaxID=2081032 RepID=UPI000D0BD2EA|nr:YcgL domain-containing protein [Phytohalomonas tamaricis]
MTERLICQVFKSTRKDEMYLYVDKARGLQDIPEALSAMFGRPEPVMTVLLTPEKKLARADATKVIETIRSQGYYLQMPPPRDESKLDPHRAPTQDRY